MGSADSAYGINKCHSKHSLPLAAQKKPCERGRSAKWHRHVQRWVLGRTALAPNGSDSTFHPAFGFKSTELPSQPPRQQGPWSPLLWKLINFEPARNSGFGGHSCMHACMRALSAVTSVSIGDFICMQFEISCTSWPCRQACSPLKALK